MRTRYLPLCYLVLATLACTTVMGGGMPVAPPTLPGPNVSILTATPSGVVATSPPIVLPPDVLPSPTVIPLATVSVVPPVVLAPGQYLTQPGDTLTALIARYRAVTAEVLSQNPNLPLAQTLPPGLLLTFSTAGYTPNAFATRLIPDSELVRSPVAAQFSVRDYVLAQPGWLATYTEVLEDEEVARPGWQIVQKYAERYSLNPRLLLALLEYQAGALSRPAPIEDFIRDYPLGAYSTQMLPGLSHQLGWAGNQLLYGYYGWRDGSVLNLSLADGAFRTVDPSLNAGTFALVRLLGLVQKTNTWNQALSAEGFVATYRQWFGEPWGYAMELFPGYLTQPELQLPFEPGQLWSFTGGPHPPYGRTLPFGALDFAPPAEQSGCFVSSAWATAMHDGVVLLSDEGRVELDIGDGWTLVYLHVATQDRVQVGAVLKAGQPVGHPSCEGGRATGAHVHISRRYNGEWLPVAGPVPFVMSGWLAHNGDRPYQGTLTRDALTVVACPCADGPSKIQLEP